jgi:hypothetical protein
MDLSVMSEQIKVLVVDDSSLIINIVLDILKLKKSQTVKEITGRTPEQRYWITKKRTPA